MVRTPILPVVIAVAALVVHERAAAAAPTAGLYPSAILYHKLHHDDVPAQLRRIAELGFHRAQLIVTVHAEIDAENAVLRYHVQDGRRLVPLSNETLAAFRATLHTIFAEAKKLGVELSVTAHLNSAGPRHEWRNHFRFDPTADYDGFSYQHAVIDSIAAAAAAELPAGTEVDFDLCGEMGRSVFEHAESYRRMMADLRGAKSGPRWRLGVSLNFQDQANGIVPDAAQLAAVNALLAESDRLGISEYRWFMLPPDAGDFAGAVEAFYAGLDALGVAGHRKLPLSFTEVGLGGGAGENRPASLPLMAAMRPWEGVSQRWQSPWKAAGMRKFRVDFHRALLDFLAAPGDKAPVVDAFLWTELSWDPLDVIDCGFADEEIAKLIRDHDDRLAPGKLPDEAGKADAQP